jgi:hypothetical protein
MMPPSRLSRQLRCRRRSQQIRGREASFLLSGRTLSASDRERGCGLKSAPSVGEREVDEIGFAGLESLDRAWVGNHQEWCHLRFSPIDYFVQLEHNRITETRRPSGRLNGGMIMTSEIKSYVRKFFPSVRLQFSIHSYNRRSVQVFSKKHELLADITVNDYIFGADLGQKIVSTLGGAP